MTSLYIPLKASINTFDVNQYCTVGDPCRHSVIFQLKTGEHLLVSNLASPRIKDLYAEFDLPIPLHFVNAKYRSHDVKKKDSRCCVLL